MRYLPFVLLAMLLLCGCDLFRLRDTEAPETTDPPLWNDPTSWDNCRQNLEYCYEDDRNAVKYYGLFTSGFSFHFDPQDSLDFNLNGPLSRSQEQDLLFNLHEQAGHLDVSLRSLPGQADDIGPSSARIIRGYTISRTRSGDPEPKHYSGRMELRFVKSGAWWYIDRWFDYRSASDSLSWGNLKHEFLQ